MAQGNGKKRIRDAKAVREPQTNGAAEPTRGALPPLWRWVLAWVAVALLSVMWLDVVISVTRHARGPDSPLTPLEERYINTPMTAVGGMLLLGVLRLMHYRPGAGRIAAMLFIGAWLVLLGFSRIYGVSALPPWSAKWVVSVLVFRGFPYFAALVGVFNMARSPLDGRREVSGGNEGCGGVR